MRNPNFTALEISKHAVSNTNPQCKETLDVFTGLLGVVAGNLALTLGAKGGVYIGGGIVPKLGDFFERSPFRQRFEAKGRFQNYLKEIPVFVIKSKYPALIGIKQGKEESLSNYQNSLNITVKNIYKEYHHDFINKIGLLDAYSPLKSLSRGYSLVYKKNELVKRVSQLSLNDEVKLVLDDGIVKASIKEIKDGK